MQHTQQSSDTAFDSYTYSEDDPYLEYDEKLKFNFSDIFSYVGNKIKSVYTKATDAVDDEFSLPVSQDQINDALKKFVTNNVKAILELRVELHDDWFRLYCTVNVKGIYAEVASNFALTHIQVDRHVQRLVFEQLTNTDVLSLRCESFIKRVGIKLVIWFYHSVLHRDPLGFILSKINIVRPKENILYLDLHRWLKKNKKIMSTLQKVQVNYGVVEEEQLVLKTQVNIREVISNQSADDIITPADEPKLMEGPTHPISDAAKPSYS